MPTMTLPKIEEPVAPSAPGTNSKISGVSGKFAGFDIELNDNQDRTVLLIVLEDATISREDGSQNQVDEFTVYHTWCSAKEKDEDGSWVPAVINEDGSPAQPKRTSVKPFIVGDPFYDVLQPLYKERFGMDLKGISDGTVDASEFAGEVLNYERQTVTRRWARRDGTLGDPLTNSKILRDEDGQFERTDDGSNRVIYVSDSGTELLYEGNGQFSVLATGENTDETPASEIITTTQLLPAE